MGLRTASIVGLGAPIVMALAGLLGIPGIFDAVPPGRTLFVTSLAVATLLLTFVPTARHHLRLVGITSGYLLALEAIFGLLRAVPPFARPSSPAPRSFW